MRIILLFISIAILSVSHSFGQRVLVNHEDANQLIPGDAFGAGTLDGPVSNVVTTIENPDKSGINTTDSVSQFIEPAEGETWMGVFYDVDTATYGPMVFAGDSSTLCADVWIPNNGGFVFKVENPGNGGFNWEGPTIANTTTSAWEQVCQDFTGTPAENEVITRLVIFFNIGEIPAAATTYYFDNIQQPGASAFVNIEGFKFGGYLKAYPNPTSNVLRVAENLSAPHTMIVSDLTGREVLRVENTMDGVLDVSNLTNGAYFVRAINNRTHVARTARFLKN